MEVGNTKPTMSVRIKLAALGVHVAWLIDIGGGKNGVRMGGHP